MSQSQFWINHFGRASIAPRTMLRVLQIAESVCGRQLVSLLHQPAPGLPLPSPLQHARWASDKALQYAKDRKHHESDLSQLRKQWAEEHHEAAARRAEAEAAAETRRAAAKASRAQADAATKESSRQELAARQQVDREVRALAKAARLQRQEVREDILEVAREER